MQNIHFIIYFDNHTTVFMAVRLMFINRFSSEYVYTVTICLPATDAGP
ncbi:hypothetical protein MNB_SV-10-720 [hydrothermal vent metagenome]|uniref:Uncharacterized protein n=1 Tax=hydrothermal vent metagenome TaxID=652676 RepID=A0A1W1CH20_9ZZZZ